MKKQKKDKRRQSTQQLMGIQKITDYCISTDAGDLVFYIIIGAYCARALAPTFSWGEPTMAVFRPHSPLGSAVLRFPSADYFRNLLILTAPGELTICTPIHMAFLFRHGLSMSRDP